MRKIHSSKASIHSLAGGTRRSRQRRRQSVVEQLESRAMLTAISNSALASVGDVFYIDLENHNLTQPSPGNGTGANPDQIMGNPAAPFINGLIQQFYEGPLTFGGVSGSADVTVTNETSSQIAGTIVLLNAFGQGISGQSVADATGTFSGTATGADAYSGTISGIANGPTTLTLTVGATLSGTLGGTAGSGTFGPLTRDNAAAAQTSWASDYQNVVQPNGTAVHPSEPNYIWQEGGSNFGVLGNDDDPYANNGNSDSNKNTNVKLVAATGNDPDNLSGLLQNAKIPWKSYQEDIDLTPSSGSVNQPGANALTSTVAPTSDWTVPVQSFSGSSSAYTNPYNNNNYYAFAVKHDGQLFYTATNGGSLSSPDLLHSNPETSHYDPLQQLQADLNSNSVGRYNLITPDLYNDMHNSLPAGTTFKYAGITYDDANHNDNNDQEAIAEGDNFLSMIIPEIMNSQAYKNNGMIVIWTDEAEPGTSGPSYAMTEIVISPLAKGNSYDSTLTYTHSSDLKTMQELFNVSASTPTGFLGDTATSSLTSKANDLTDLFKPALSATAATVTSTGGVMFNGTLATFTDADGNTDTSQYKATIDWGDKSPLTTVSGSSISETGGTFSVAGSHTYSQEGVYSLTLTVTDSDGATATSSPVVTADFPVSATVSSVSATEAATFNGTVATFTDADPAGAASQFTALINWGDSSTLSTVSGSSITESNGTFSVAGTHVYAEEGTYTMTVTVSDTGGAMATVNPQAVVSDAPLTGTSANLMASTTLSGTVASFSDPDTADTTADYSASIDWGDGNTTTGTIAAAGTPGEFNVTGDHTYNTGSAHTITVTVSHGTDLPLVIKTPEPGAPIVTNPVYVIGTGTITVSAANGLLANDTGPSTLSITAVTAMGAQGGTFTLNADGSFTYVPPTSFPGYDSAQFTVTDTAGDKITATVTVLSQQAGVVWKFYESVLNRIPDPGGLQYWTNDINNGGKTGDIAFGFFESDELLNEIITNYYQQYLLRTPDDAGLTYWKGIWHATGGPEQIKAGFADSPEFYGSAGGTPQSWLTALYQRILSRTPDSAGLSFWENFYQQQTAAGTDPGTVRYEIALGFFDSPEGYADDVAGWFQEYLLRAPMAAESAQYVSQMQAGASDRTIEQEITNLPEYANNPPAPAAGTASALPDFYQKNNSI